MIFSEEQALSPAPNEAKDERGQMGYHLQGYVYYPSRKSLKQLTTENDDLKIRGHSLHWKKCTETAKSTNRCIQYCSKRGDPTFLHGPYEEGQRPMPGRRTDLELIKSAVDANQTAAQLWDNHFPTMAKYHRAISVYKSIKAVPRHEPSTVMIFHGEAGSGKSRDARAEHPDYYALPHPKGSGVYWDNYQGQECVIIDEFHGGFFSFGDLLVLTDRYGYTCPIHHGAGLQFTSKTIIFTSNVPPSEWYKGIDTERWKAFKRRVSQVRIYKRDQPYSIEDGWGTRAFAIDDAIDNEVHAVLKSHGSSAPNFLLAPLPDPPLPATVREPKTKRRKIKPSRDQELLLLSDPSAQ